MELIFNFFIYCLCRHNHTLCELYRCALKDEAIRWLEQYISTSTFKQIVRDIYFYDAVGEFEQFEQTRSGMQTSSVCRTELKENLVMEVLSRQR